MVKATVGGTLLADSTETVTVFPPGAVKTDLFSESNTHTTCGWKGVANYYNVNMPDGTLLKDAAWYYPDVKDAAKNIEGYVAFYKSKIQISE